MLRPSSSHPDTPKSSAKKRRNCSPPPQSRSPCRHVSLSNKRHKNRGRPPSPIAVLIDGRPPSYLPRPASPSYTPAIAHRIAQRQKAIDFGKNTAGYENYCRKVDREERRRRGGIVEGRPNTPDVNLDIGTRRWQGIVKAWRRQLHFFDPPGLAEEHRARVAEAAKEGDALCDPLSRILDGVKAGTEEERSNVQRIVDGGLVEVMPKESAEEAKNGIAVRGMEVLEDDRMEEDMIDCGAESSSDDEDDLL